MIDKNQHYGILIIYCAQEKETNQFERQKRKQEEFKVRNRGSERFSNLGFVIYFTHNFRFPIGRTFTYLLLLFFPGKKTSLSRPRQETDSGSFSDFC